MALLALLALGLARPARTADPVTVEWVARYNGTAGRSDVARKMVVDGSGNVYVTGYSAGVGTSNDYATVKYDANGNQQWAARYDGPANGADLAASLAVDGSGNVYVTGVSRGVVAGQDYATVKYDANGNELWVRRYNGPGGADDAAAALKVDGSGNVYVTGYALIAVDSGESDPNFIPEYATVKYDTDGNEQWVRHYHGPGHSRDLATALAVDGSGNVYITGYSEGDGTGADYATVKYDTNGNQQWVARYDGPAGSFDGANGLALDGSSNVYVTGESEGIGTGSDYATVKYDTNGNQQWVARYDGLANDYDSAGSLAVDGSGNVYITGTSTGYSDPFAMGYDFATVKYNANGIQQWVARFNGPANDLDQPRSLALDGSGNVYVTGTSRNVETGQDYATVKYDTGGNLVWVQRYDGGLNSTDQGVAVAVDGSGNVYATGASRGGVTLDDYATVKYSQAPAVDTTAPTASQLAVVTESSTRIYVPFNLADAGSGLAKARLTANSSNCVLEWTGPSGVVTQSIGTDLFFSPAGLAGAQVRAVKVNSSQKARVELQVWDVAGNLALVDPVIANLEIKKRQLARVFQQIPQAERYVTLQNGTPGLTRATLTVNGHIVSHGRLTEGQVVTLDVAGWLRPGNRNVLRLAASGPKGATALFVISDQQASAGAPVAAGAAVNLEFAP